MSNNSNSSNNDNDHRSTNLAEFEFMEAKHKYGLDKYPELVNDFNQLEATHSQ